MWIKGEKFEPADSKIEQLQPNEESDNKYLEYNFIKFSILASFVVGLFPFSILLMLYFLGTVDTLLALAALWDDFIKTLLALLAILIPAVILIIYLIV